MTYIAIQKLFLYSRRLIFTHWNKKNLLISKCKLISMSARGENYLVRNFAVKGYSMLWQDVSTAVTEFIKAHQLPDDYKNLSAQFFFPLAQNILTKHHSSQQPLLLGINGAQGTGKSTLAALLKCILESGAGLKCAALSIDDFYLTRTERADLAQHIHPLLQVRGVPGTHDLTLGTTVINALMQSTPSKTLCVPRFDKALDDRKPLEEWHTQMSPVDVVILEGWCVGARAQVASMLVKPINNLETTEDQNAIWRTYVNQQLATHYQTLFARLDYLIMLKAPSMQAIEEWRWLQEQQLTAATKGQGEGLMNQSQVKRFIQHYERLTQHILTEMPARADAVFHLNHDHQVELATGPLIEDAIL